MNKNILFVFILFFFGSCNIHEFKEMVVCDCESINEDCFEGDSYGSRFDNNYFSNSLIRSKKFARSGKYSILIDDENPYGLAYSVKNVKAGEHFRVSCWRHKLSSSSSSIIVSANDIDSLYASQAFSSGISENDWEFLVLDVIIPNKVHNKSIKFYLYTNNGEAYFDDFSIEYIGERRVNDKYTYSSFIDSRDSNEYKIVKIGNDWWMAENLSFIDEYIGKSYRNSDVLKEKFGALYNFNEAQVVVPKGWKIPSDDDWQKLERSIGIDSVQAFEIGFRGNNVAYMLKPFGDSGFEVLKAGAYSENYYNIERNAYFWTSSAIDSVYAYCREINQKSGVGKFKDKKSMCFSVRCIKIKK